MTYTVTPPLYQIDTLETFKWFIFRPLLQLLVILAPNKYQISFSFAACLFYVKDSLTVKHISIQSVIKYLGWT